MPDRKDNLNTEQKYYITLNVSSGDNYHMYRQKQNHHTCTFFFDILPLSNSICLFFYFGMSCPTYFALLPYLEIDPTTFSKSNPYISSFQLSLNIIHTVQSKSSFIIKFPHFLIKHPIVICFSPIKFTNFSVKIWPWFLIHLCEKPYSRGILIVSSQHIHSKYQLYIILKNSPLKLISF